MNEHGWLRVCCDSWRPWSISLPKCLIGNSALNSAPDRLTTAFSPSHLFLVLAVRPSSILHSPSNVLKLDISYRNYFTGIAAAGLNPVARFHRLACSKSFSPMWRSSHGSDFLCACAFLSVSLEGIFVHDDWGIIPIDRTGYNIASRAGVRNRWNCLMQDGTPEEAYVEIIFFLSFFLWMQFFTDKVGL